MNIIGKSKLWFAISTLMVILSLAGLVFNVVVRGSAMNFGIDFTGGSLLNLRFEKTITVAQVRSVMDDFKHRDSVIQRSGEKDILIRTEPLEGDQRAKIVSTLQEKYGKVDVLEADTIGPLIGKELREGAFWAIIIAMAGITIYVGMRFESFKYSAAAILALFHDAIITTGVMAILWRSIDVTFVAGILTILGYSINDTIVIFDRIRENLKKPGASKLSFPVLVNTSLIETLARSINTVLTTLFMALTLLFFGGETLKNFCFMLVIGFTLGAYSSIFVAAPLLVAWQKRPAAKRR